VSAAAFRCARLRARRKFPGRPRGARTESALTAAWRHFQPRLRSGLTPSRSASTRCNDSEFLAQFPRDSPMAGPSRVGARRGQRGSRKPSAPRLCLLRLLGFSLPIIGVVLYYGAGRPWPGTVPRSVSREESSRPGASTGGLAPAVEHTLVQPASTSENPRFRPRPLRRRAPRRQPISFRLVFRRFAQVGCLRWSIGATAVQRQLGAASG
jgi:hypothetical protein